MSSNSHNHLQISIRCISNEEGRKLTCSRSLADLWTALTESELVSLAEEVTLTIKKIRHLANSRMCPRTYPELPNLRHSIIFKGFDFSVFSHQGSNSSIFRELTQAMDDNEGILAGEDRPMIYWIRDQFLKKMPTFGSFTFTHGDLSAKHIFVNTNTHKLTAIAGWSNAEYCPVFWEYSCLLWDDLPCQAGSVSRNRQWKRILKGALEKHEPHRDLFQAGNWIKALGIFRNRQNLHPQRMNSVMKYLNSDYYPKELEPECYGHSEL
ncbi:hypothetical protein QBC38DRAFT_544817 [Podospora fimiseda]|uniref:Aminoglycoside phosphotransferase domain-containing protein n=1 Tax=Podospora fimiseda TaxID=252190 RepID=A0AAN7BQX0_9PEZI|nr:hypothetical protein QBC38DRAFT_544817 [Podospora fimiseda]